MSLQLPSFSSAGGAGCSFLEWRLGEGLEPFVAGFSKRRSFQNRQFTVDDPLDDRVHIARRTLHARTLARLAAFPIDVAEERAALAGNFSLDASSHFRFFGHWPAYRGWYLARFPSDPVRRSLVQKLRKRNTWKSSPTELQRLIAEAVAETQRRATFKKFSRPVKRRPPPRPPAFVSAIPDDLPGTDSLSDVSLHF